MCEFDVWFSQKMRDYSEGFKKYLSMDYAKFKNSAWEECKSVLLELTNDTYKVKQDCNSIDDSFEKLKELYK